MMFIGVIKKLLESKPLMSIEEGRNLGVFSKKQIKQSRLHFYLLLIVICLKNSLK